jgi:hypothetical protein
MSPNRTKGERGEEVRKRIERWKERVDRAQRMRKKTYWKTMGCWARRRKLVSFRAVVIEGLEEVCFSMRAQVR